MKTNPATHYLSTHKVVLALTFLCGAIVGLALPARTPSTLSPGESVGVVRTALARISNPAGADIYEANRSAIPGFVEARTREGMVYVTSDGRFLLEGDLYDTKSKTNLTLQRLEASRAKAIADFDPSSRITFPAAHETASVTVFTDLDCPYCHRFQQQMDAYNAAGITVHYLPFPLNIHPNAERKAQAVWCAKDRAAAFTAAMGGVDPGSGTCVNPVDASLKLALAVGINGTPSIIAADGALIPTGIAMSPEGLAKELTKHAREDGAAKS